MHEALHNYFLAALPADIRKRVLANIELVELALGEVLYESGEVQQYGYFPTSMIASLLYVTEDGASAEIAVVGKEGIVGVALFTGGENTPHKALIQSAGCAYRIRGEFLKEEFNLCGPFQYWLLRYMQALLMQMAQTAVCNRHHTVEKQLCRGRITVLDPDWLERHACECYRVVRDEFDRLLSRERDPDTLSFA